MNKYFSILLLMFVYFAHQPVYAVEEYVSKSKELKFGLLPYISVTRLIKTFLPLKQYLEKRTSYKVKFLTAPTFEKFIERTQDHQYDIVFTAPHFALLAKEKAGYERLVRFSRQLTACVFVCKNSHVHSLKELKGAVVSVPDSLAIVSVLGEMMLKKAGLQVSSDINFIHTLSHNNTMLSVLNDRSDAGIVASAVYELFLKSEKNNTRHKKFRLLSCSEPVPSAMFLANDGLPEEHKIMLKRLLLNFSLSKDGEEFFSNTAFKGMRLISDVDLMEMEKYMGMLQARL